MIVKFFIFLMQSDGVLLQQKSTANTDGCIYSAYSEIFLILYVFVFFYFFFILLPVLDGMLYNVTMVFLFIFQITAGRGAYSSSGISRALAVAWMMPLLL